MKRILLLIWNRHWTDCNGTPEDEALAREEDPGYFFWDKNSAGTGMFRIRKPLIPHNKHRFTITIIKGVFSFASASTATGNKDQSTAEGFGNRYQGFPECSTRGPSVVRADQADVIGHFRWHRAIWRFRIRHRRPNAGNRNECREQPGEYCFLYSAQQPEGRCAGYRIFSYR
jgi:hypothetical protein